MIPVDRSPLSGEQESAMATHPIFAHENGQRIAINPDHVVNLTEIEPQRILISFPNEGSVTVAMELESVIARLTDQPSRITKSNRTTSA